MSVWPRGSSMIALAQVIEPLLRPRALLEHGASFGRGQPFNHQPQRLASGVGVDRSNPVNHRVEKVYPQITQITQIQNPTRPQRAPRAQRMRGPFERPAEGRPRGGGTATRNEWARRTPPIHFIVAVSPPAAPLRAASNGPPHLRNLRNLRIVKTGDSGRRWLNSDSRCARTTRTTSCCRCRKATSSRWPSTRACASGSWRRASSRPTSSTKRRPPSGTTSRWSTTRAIVDAVANGTVPPDIQRRIGFPWSPQMVERARRSVGATIAAARVSAR